MDGKRFDLVVLGAGPGGYVAAIRAAQEGMQVACVDENDAVGGTCLRVGCIPSKVMLESSERYAETRSGLAQHGIVVGSVELDLAALHARRERIVKTLATGVNSLFRQNGVTRIRGRGQLAGSGRVAVAGPDGDQVLATQRVLVATGSRAAELPGIPLDGERVGTSTEALAYATVPDHLVVIGAGYIGLEMGSVWSRLGARVTVLEALDRILPGMDLELAQHAQKILEKQGLQFQLGVRVEQVTVNGERCTVTCAGASSIDCDRVLVAVGRVPNTDGIGLDTVGIELTERGEIPINAAWETTAPGVYALGDCVAGPKLAHKASHEALACVAGMVGHPHGPLDLDTIPGVVYTHPELATVGQSEQQLQEAGHAYRKGVFPFLASGRARTLGVTDGFVKVLADEATDRVLGVHILGPRAGDLIAEACAAMQFGASAEDLAQVCHAHPTLAEALGEAALGVSDRAIHMANRRTG